jgi:hypothetical protein
VIACFPASSDRKGAEAIVVEQDDEERRIAALEAVRADPRITRVETQTDELQWQVRAVLCGTATLLVEAAFRVTDRVRERKL